MRPSVNLQQVGRDDGQIFDICLKTVYLNRTGTKNIAENATVFVEVKLKESFGEVISEVAALEEYFAIRT